jgi:hypothetical protein
VRLIGLATVTFGGGGAACCWLRPQAATIGIKPIKTTAAKTRGSAGMRVEVRIMTNAGYI